MILPPAYIDNAIELAAKAAQIPAAIVRSVAYHESRYNPRAESPSGAKGLMQIMPVNYSKYNVTNPFDALESARAGAEILASLKKRHGTWDRALAAYNWGTGNVKNSPDPEDWPENTRKYVEKVLESANVPTLPIAIASSEQNSNAATLFLALVPAIVVWLNKNT